MSSGLSLLPVPDGVSIHTFRTVLAGASAAYTVNKGVPTVEQIKVYTASTKRTISKVVGTKEFKAVMKERGFPFDSGVKLTPEQYFAIGIITDPTNRKPLAAKLKSAGVTYATYRAWLKQPHFRDYVSKVAEDMLGEHVQDIHTRVVERASAGDLGYTKLYYELTGRHDPNRQQMVDLNGIIGLMLEVITRYVPDTNALAAITKDIDLILTGGVPKALEQFDVSLIAGEDAYDPNVEDAVIVLGKTPVEKAQELVDKFNSGAPIGDLFTKE